MLDPTQANPTFPCSNRAFKFRDREVPRNWTDANAQGDFNTAILRGVPEQMEYVFRVILTIVKYKLMSIDHFQIECDNNDNADCEHLYECGYGFRT